MDPLTQGLLGAAASHACFGRSLPRSAWLIGMAGGMAPDLDFLIALGDDPIGYISYHRHFTHALAFIPIGGLIAALPFLFWPAFRARRWAVLGAATVAYATHGPLDAFTSYGTVLWWPFSDTRVAWDMIGIIDPVFTAALLVGVVAGVWWKRRWPAAVALVVCAMYLGLGWSQRERGLDVQRQVAEARGHQIVRGRVMPTPVNLVIWRSIYEADDGRIHTDTLRIVPWREAKVRTGASAPRLDADALAERGHDDPTLRDFARYRWFADGYTALDEDEPRLVTDMRYLLDVERVRSIWSLRLPPPGSAAPVEWIVHRSERGEMAASLWDKLRGRDERFATLGNLRAGAGE